MRTRQEWPDCVSQLNKNEMSRVDIGVENVHSYLCQQNLFGWTSIQNEI